jgi:hypothetical protein
MAVRVTVNALRLFWLASAALLVACGLASVHANAQDARRGLAEPAPPLQRMGPTPPVAMPMTTASDLQRRINALAARIGKLEGEATALWLTPTCSLDHQRWLIIGEKKSDCAPYECLPGAGRCKTHCTVAADCQVGNVCESGACVSISKKP